MTATDLPPTPDAGSITVDLDGSGPMPPISFIVRNYAHLFAVVSAASFVAGLLMGMRL